MLLRISLLLLFFLFCAVMSSDIEEMTTARWTNSTPTETCSGASACKDGVNITLNQTFIHPVTKALGY